MQVVGANLWSKGIYIPKWGELWDCPHPQSKMQRLLWPCDCIADGGGGLVVGLASENIVF